MQAENQNRVIVEGDWAVLEYRERVFILVTVAYVPVVFLCLVSFSYWQGDVPDHFGLLAGGLGLLGFVLADILRRRFQCPRCGRPFAKASELHPARCAHCGLKRGTTGPLTSIGPQQ